MPSRHRHRSRVARPGAASGPWSRGGIVLLVTAIAVIALLTLRSVETNDNTAFCLVCEGGQTADFLTNVALFIPLGMALALLGLRTRSIVALGATTSAVIETMQLLVLTGRFASPLDVAANALGAAAGALLVARADEVLYPHSRLAGVLAGGGTVLWFVVITLTAILLNPSIPGGRLTGQIAPDVEFYDRFSGRVDEASIGAVPISDGPLAESDAIRAMRDSLRVDAAATPGHPTRDVAPIVRVVDEAGREILVLGRRQAQLVFRTRVLATGIRLQTPTLVIDGGFANLHSSSETPLSLVAQRRGGSLHGSVAAVSGSLQLHPALGWMLLVPLDTGDPAVRDLLSSLWAAAPLAAVGYWAGRRARRRARRSGRDREETRTGRDLTLTLPLVAFLIIVGLAGVPLLFGLPVPPAGVWLTCYAALGIGVAAGIGFAMRRGSHHRGATARSDASEPRVVGLGR